MAPAAARNAPNQTIVPFTPYEWQYVRQLFRSKRACDVKECIIILATWISRTGENTPVAISCSHVLLQAVHSELLLEGMCASERYMAIDDLRSKHGFAIVRFVNYINEMGQTAGTLRNMVDACKIFGIPRNIVNIRHALTHQNCPDIVQLRYATNFCLDWLWKNFWVSDARVAMSSEKAVSSARGGDSFDFGAQQGREQQYVASLRAFNTWRQKNRKLTDVECLSSDELTAIKKHVLVDTAGFLACLLRDGHLIQTPSQLRNLKLTTSAAESYVISEHIQSFWEPVFHMLFTLKVGADFIVAVLWRLREPRIVNDSKNQLTAYARMILKQFDEADMFSDDEWVKVLDNLLPVAKFFNTELVDSVMARCTKLTRKRRKQIHRILDISTASPNTSISTEDPFPLTPGGGAVHTVEDLQMLLKRERKAKTQPVEVSAGADVELCDADDWSDVPFGICPGQRLETFTVVVEESESLGKRKAFDAAITLEDDDDDQFHEEVDR